MPMMSLTNILLFGSVVVFFLWLDLYRHRNAQTMPVKSALIWSIGWVSLAMLFAGYVGLQYGKEKALLFVAGYLLEESLSIDNLFVFMAIFANFGVKDAYQHRILYYGILGAVIMRLVFVFLGTSLLLAGEINQLLHTIVFSLFGVAVLFSAWHMYRALDQDPSDMLDYTKHWSVRWLRKVLPVSPELDGNRFFVKREGRWFATPLFLCLVTVEISDVAFAFDSVPAVIAITRDPFLVYTSNIFAILGLRSLYFLLNAARRYLHHLEKAIVAILAFIGVKLLLEAFHIEIGIGASLSVVLGGLLLGVVASLLFPKRD